MKSLLQKFRKEEKEQPLGECGVGIVFAPGPDKGLYVREIAEGGPAWRANEGYSGPINGRESVVRVGDCLLDVQDVLEPYNPYSDKPAKKGKKHDVFGKNLSHVIRVLRGPPDSYVELTFRRVTNRGLAVPVTVCIQRGEPATTRDVDNYRVKRLSAELQERFKDIDEDNSGEISLDEVVSYLLRNPLPGQGDVWKTANFLFKRADKDESGSISAAEFEKEFNKLYEQMASQTAPTDLEEQAEVSIEEAFSNSLASMREDLIRAIHVIKRPYMMQLWQHIRDPEDAFLISSMYRLEGYDSQKPGSGKYILHSKIYDASSQFFWKCFLRIHAALHTAQAILKKEMEQEFIDEEEEEGAIIEVSKLLVLPRVISLDELSREHESRSTIMVNVSRCPGRGYPPRLWQPKEKVIDLFASQKFIEMPSPFIGRTESVYHVIESLTLKRLNTIIGETGFGKSYTLRAVLHTLQVRAEESPTGRYMYKDGVFLVDCIDIRSFERLAYVLGTSFGLLSVSVKEIIRDIHGANFLLALDGVDGLLDIGLSEMRTFITDLLEGCPGMSMIMTCNSACGIPYENIIGLTMLNHNELAQLVCYDFPPGKDYRFTSSEVVCDYLNGNPFAARLAASLISEKISPAEMQDVISTLKDIDVRNTRASLIDADPWADGTRVILNLDGSVYGSSLCLCAWMKMALGHTTTHFERAYNFVRFLVFFPGGVLYRDVTALVHEAEKVLDWLINSFKFVDVLNLDGTTCSLKEAIASKSAVLKLRTSVAKVVNIMNEPFPKESRRYLKLMFPLLERHAEDVLQSIEHNDSATAVMMLSMIESNILSCTDAEVMLRADICGTDTEMIESIGKVSYTLAIILMSFNRLPEALDACATACFFFKTVCEYEITGPSIAQRRLDDHPVKGPASLARGLRLSGEIKLMVGALDSAMEDLKNGYLLECPKKLSVIAFSHLGSPIGQGDCLTALGEIELLTGDFPASSEYLKHGLKAYREVNSEEGISVLKVLASQLKAATGDMLGAFSTINFSIQKFREGESAWRLASALCNRSEYALSISNLARAREDIQEALTIFLIRNDLVGVALAKKLLGECCYNLTEYPAAIRHLSEAKTFAHMAHSDFLEGESERCMGLVTSTHIFMGEGRPRYAHAIKHMNNALAIFGRIHYLVGEGNCYRSLAAIYKKLKHKHHRIESLNLALKAYQRVGHRLGIAIVDSELARIYEKMGKLEEANTKVQEALPALQASRLLMVEGNDRNKDSQKPKTSLEEDDYWKKK
ncbi:hypothetical protein GUITHDRAFT_105942 [Guillardia theta CCMP2712]|uniref:Calmodulin n=1 Tax=Guillardia theta (strain CCMP2712) TaxID=905079 RepID=L1JJT4_GUITC|nr:hypothetical protein GUITHDRAFT_105942 [Guillardia theta CCMP2712]EKX48335.1 hypothetical protein GUITHDRAFT_105942 [Guillardia theta CCMP2712]|eukprot:XP_005835315.1 hypothetical protein GUITHDRAFT_105942 [Guillardia theta CCMP2712]